MLILHVMEVPTVVKPGKKGHLQEDINVVFVDRWVSKRAWDTYETIPSVMVSEVSWSLKDISSFPILNFTGEP